VGVVICKDVEGVAVAGFGVGFGSAEVVFFKLVHEETDVISEVEVEVVVEV
jgi:hypothetical protein